jgi:zinc/manganese transport system permease protein
MNAVLDWFLAPFGYEFMQRALAAAFLLGVSGGLLGVLLLLRRLALMGDALAHALLPGIGLAYLAFGPSPAALLIGALAAGLVAGLGSAFVARLTRIKDEAAFAAFFIVLFAAGVALVSSMRTRIDLSHFLFGNVLGVGPGDLALMGATTVVTAAVFAVFRRSLILESFDPVFYRAIGGRGALLHFAVLGLTVLNLVAALQAMGVVLALGLFILPAVAAYLWTDRLAVLLGLSVATAVAGAAAGLLLSYHLGIASGSAIVLVLGSWFFASALFSPRYGMLVKILRVAREGRGVLHTPE